MTKTFKITIGILILLALAAGGVFSVSRKQRPPSALTGQGTPSSTPSARFGGQASDKEGDIETFKEAEVVGAENVKEITPETDMDTSNWKTYRNEEYGFSFKYPEDWKFMDGGRGGSSGKPVYTISLDDPEIAAVGHYDNDLPETMVIRIYNDLSGLDSKNLGMKTLKDYLDKYTQQGDPYPLYQNIRSIMIGTKEGFVADAGPNQFGGGTNYFTQLGNSKIVKIWSFKAHTDHGITEKILSTFEFND